MNVDDIFRAAVRLDESARRKLLERLDTDVRGQIQQLLAADEAAQREAFLEISIDATGAVPLELQDGQGEPSTMVLGGGGTPNDEHTRTGIAELAEWARPGSRNIGNFLIVRQIGRGGMGVVYEAIEQPLNRHVALKVLPPGGLISDTQRERFRNDSRAAAQLQHPNIVPVYSVGDHEGILYFAMRLIRGQNLAQIVQTIRRDVNAREPAGTNAPRRSAPSGETRKTAASDVSSRPQRRSSSHVSHELDDCLTGLSAEQYPKGSTSGRFSHGSRSYFEAVARIGLHAAAALDHAHQVGIVHRDVKPGNLMIDPAGHLWVTDFGLAQIRDSAVDSDHDLTRDGDILGTLRYMSPEQASGRKGFVDNRTDVYSLGATLYELLTLQKAVPGQKEAEILHFVSFSTPQPVRRLNPRIPFELEVIVQKAMQRDPEDRYPSAFEMAEDLRRFLNGEPIRARKPTLMRRAEIWIANHRQFATSFAAMIVVILVASLAASAAIYHSMLQEADHRQRTAAALEHSEGLRLLANSALQRDTNPGLALQLAVAGAERVPGVEADAALIAALDANHELATIDTSQPVSVLAISGDESLLVSTSPADAASTGADAVPVSAVVRSLPDGVIVGELRSAEPITSATFDRRERFLVTSTYQSADPTHQPPPVVWDTATWKQSRTLSGWFLPVARSNVISRQTDSIVLCGSDGGAAVLSLQSGDVLFRLPLNKERVAMACWNHRGTQLAAVTESGTLLVYDADSSQIVRQYDPEGGRLGALTGVQFTSDGETIVVVRATGSRFYGISTEGAYFFRESQMVLSESHPLAVAGRPFRNVATVVDTRSMQPVRTIPLPLPLLSIDVKGDRVLLMCGSVAEQKLQVFDIESGDHLASLTGHAGRVSLAQFGGSRHTVISAGMDATIRHWAVLSGKQRRRVGKPGSSGTPHFQISANGESICVTRPPDSIATVFDTDGAPTRQRFEGRISEEPLMNPDVLVTSAGRVVSAWSRQSRREVSHLIAPRNVAEAVCAPGLQVAVLKTEDGQVHTWNIQTGVSKTLTRPNESANYSVSDHMVCLGTTSGEARVYDLSRDTELTSLAHRHPLRAVDLRADEQMLLTVDVDDVVRVWDLTAPEAAPKILHDPDVTVESAVFVNDGRHVVTYGYYGDHTASLWDLTDNSRVESFATSNLREVAPHASIAAVCLFFEDQPPIFWDIRSGDRQTLGDMPVPFGCFAGDQIVAAARIKANESFASLEQEAGSARGLLQVWPIDELQNGRTVFLPSAPLGIAPLGTAGKFVIRTEDFGVDVLRYESNEHLARLEGHSSAVVSMHFSEPLRRLVTTSIDGGVRIFDEQGAPLDVQEGHTERIGSADISPDGMLLASGDATGKLLLWDLASGQPNPLPEPHSAPIESVRFHDNHMVVSSARKGPLKFHDLRTMASTAVTPDGDIITFDLSPDGRQVLLITGEFRSEDLQFSLTPLRCQICNVADAECTDLGYDRPRSARFSPDGNHYAVLTSEGSVVLHAGQDNAVIHRIKLPVGRIHAMAFSPSGSQLLTWQDDGISIWELTDFSESTRFSTPPPPDALWDSRRQNSWAPWTPDGTQVLIRGADLLRWPITPLDAARRACPRELLPEERLRYGIDAPAQPAIDL